MPANFMNSQVIIQGSIITELVSIEKTDGKRVAVFHSSFDISETDLPEEVMQQGDFEFSSNGKGIYLFDMENRVFVSSEVKMDIYMLMKLKDEDLGIESNTSVIYKLNLEAIEE